MNLDGCRIQEKIVAGANSRMGFIEEMVRIEPADHFRKKHLYHFTKHIYISTGKYKCTPKLIVNNCKISRHTIATKKLVVFLAQN